MVWNELSGLTAAPISRSSMARARKIQDIGDRAERFHRLCPTGATDCGAVTTDIFGSRIDDDMGAMVERADDDRGRGVVDNQRDAQLFADLGDFGDGEDL